DVLLLGGHVGGGVLDRLVGRAVGAVFRRRGRLLAPCVLLRPLDAAYPRCAAGAHGGGVDDGGAPEPRICAEAEGGAVARRPAGRETPARRDRRALGRAGSGPGRSRYFPSARTRSTVMPAARTRVRSGSGRSG